MKGIHPTTGAEIVVKMMKAKSIKKERDLLRHIRESILLGTLRHLEDAELADSQNTDSNARSHFTQKLFGIETPRAMNFVSELGHCVAPLWISVSYLFRMPLDKWVLNGHAKQSTLRKLI